MVCIGFFKDVIVRHYGCVKVSHSSPVLDNY